MKKLRNFLPRGLFFACALILSCALHTPYLFETARAQAAENHEASIDSGSVQAARMIYLAAWTSAGAYSGKAGEISRRVLEENGWKIDRYRTDGSGSDVKFILAEKNADGRPLYFLSICGTASWQDVKTDLSVERYLFSGSSPAEFYAAMQEDVNALDETSPLVHSGFARYVQDGFFTEKSGGITFGEELLSRLQSEEQARLYITGHSLGGAAAELLAARLADMGAAKEQLCAVTFGAPAVGNQAFVDKYEPKINLTRITMTGDPVKNLSQIANTNLVQFKTNTVWKLPQHENDKFPHAVSLYFDCAMRSYYEELRPVLEKAAESADLSAADVYAQINFRFPAELEGEKYYIDAAIKEKALRSGADKYVFMRQDEPAVFSAAKKNGASAVVIYNFEASKLHDSTSTKRYYINGSRLVYSADGSLTDGRSASADTNDMTVLQAALYTVMDKTPAPQP